VFFSQPFWNQDFQLTTDEFRRAIAEELRGAATGKSDLALTIYDEERLRS